MNIASLVSGSTATQCGKTTKVKGRLTGNMAFLNEDLFMKYFIGWQNPWHIAHVEF